MPVQENERKLAELILYISQKCANHYYFGQMKLNKLLFFCDFSAYGKWGTTITNAEYQHLPKGPTVYRMLPVQDALKSDGALAIQPTDCFGFQQNRPVNLRQPDLNLFTGPEIALVDSWIERLKPMSSNDVSRLSHSTAGWSITKDSEIIDPKTVFLAWSEPSAFEIQRGLELAAQHGLVA
jgi:hypothetical protein